MSMSLSQAADRVGEEIRWARREDAGFRVVCERLGIDAAELDEAVVEVAARLGTTDEQAILHGMLVGIVSRSEGPS